VSSAASQADLRESEAARVAQAAEVAEWREKCATGEAQWSEAVEQRMALQAQVSRIGALNTQLADDVVRLGIQLKDATAFEGIAQVAKQQQSEALNRVAALETEREQLLRRLSCAESERSDAAAQIMVLTTRCSAADTKLAEAEVSMARLTKELAATAGVPELRRTISLATMKAQDDMQRIRLLEDEVVRLTAKSCSSEIALRHARGSNAAAYGLASNVSLAPSQPGLVKLRSALCSCVDALRNGLVTADVTKQYSTSTTSDLLDVCRHELLALIQIAVERISRTVAPDRSVLSATVQPLVG